MFLFDDEYKAEKTKSSASWSVGKKKAQIQKVAADMGWAIIRRVAWIVSRCLPFLVEYEYKTKVTFGLTNFSGFVSHEKCANLFGAARESFGLNRIPGFSKNVGHKYLLKTCDATYRHFDDFKFGDTIRIIIDVVWVNGASFKIRARFINAETGEVAVEAFQWIAYTDTIGKPTRFPFWLKVLLKLSERSIVNNEKKVKNEDVSGREVFKQKIMVTSAMTNAEKNVSHDEYAKLFVQTVELFMFGLGQKSSFKVEEASYKYSHDFFFGDKMIVKLFITEVEKDSTIFEVNFCDKLGKIRAQGKQKIHSIN